MARYSKSGHIIELNHMALNDWDLMWVNNAYKGKRNSVNADLINLNAKLFPSDEERQKQRVFFPLCGETVDMKYVLDQGHTVIGVEYSKIAILNFFRNQKIDYTKERCEQNERLEIFRGVGEDVTIYQGDIFDCDRATLGLFDIVWDKGSWCAINPCDRDRYVNVMHDLVTKKTRYCLNNVTLDQSIHTTHPYSSTNEEVGEYFGKYFNVDRKYFYQNEMFQHIMKLDTYVTTVYMLTLRDQKPKQRLDLRTGRVTYED